MKDADTDIDTDNDGMTGDDSTVNADQPAQDAVVPVENAILQQNMINALIVSTVDQSNQSLAVLSKCATALDDIIKNASYDLKLQAIAESNRLVATTNDTVRTNTNLFLALGIKVQCSTVLDISSMIPQAAVASNRVSSQIGFETDQSLPSASKYSLTLKYIHPADIPPRDLLDMLLRGTGCQAVARTVGPNFVTIRLENRQQLIHACDVLNAASYKQVPLLQFCEVTSSTKSAYSLRSFPFPSTQVSSWFNDDRTMKYDVAITALNRDNNGWFPDNDVESIEFFKASAPAGRKDKDNFIGLRIFVSMAAYRHFLRSSHDITNIECNGHFIKVKEEVNIVQCWNCCSFGHYSNQCANSFKCRFCLADHAQNATCIGKDDPKCRLCSANNDELSKKLASGDSSPGVTNFPDWRQSSVDHFATSASCRSVQHVKAIHLHRLKHAAFARMPLPRFSFP